MVRRERHTFGEGALHCVVTQRASTSSRERCAAEAAARRSKVRKRASSGSSGRRQWQQRTGSSTNGSICKAEVAAVLQHWPLLLLPSLQQWPLRPHRRASQEAGGQRDRVERLAAAVLRSRPIFNQRGLDKVRATSAGREFPYASAAVAGCRAATRLHAGARKATASI